jgi:hypothetical protein
MPSSFKSLDLFGSGPHRFRVLPEGELVVPNTRLNPLQPGSTGAGLLELSIEVHGRLVASSESALWILRDAITSLLVHPPALGTLIDSQGRSWTTMSFVRFETGDRTDRGRVRSIAYRAVFLRFA